MLIDELVTDWDAFERHATVVHAPRERVWEAIRELDLARSFLVRSLFRLRGLGCPYRDDAEARFRFTLDDLMETGFVLLAEQPGEEIVLGIVGKFWRPRGPVRRIAAHDFAAFAEPGWAKAAWSFSLEEPKPGTVIVTTETRVRCTDVVARRAFLRYWRAIRPFSGLVRREALRLVRRTAEGRSRL